MNNLFGGLIYIWILTCIAAGVFHPIVAIFRLIFAGRMDSEYAIGLKKYLGIVVLYFALLPFITMLSIKLFIILYLFVLAPYIGYRYLKHVIIHDRKKKRIKDYDKEAKAKTLLTTVTPLYKEEIYTEEIELVYINALR